MANVIARAMRTTAATFNLAIFGLDCTAPPCSPG
jgi:hypothetical protein